MKSIIKKLLLVTIIICIPITFYGCYDYSEINDLEFIVGFAIDKVEDSDEYLVTFEILEPAQDQKSMQSNIIKAEGRTIHEAIRKTILKTGKMPINSHVNTVIISKQIAENGIIPVIDLINRDVEVQSDMHVFISKSHTAGEILENNKNNNVLSFQLINAQKSEQFSGQYINKRLYELIQDLAEEGISPVASIVELTTENDVVIDGTAVFKGDKLVGFLSGDESMYLSIIKNINGKGILVMPQNNANIVLEITNLKTSITPTIDDEIEMQINTKITGVISELSRNNIELSSEEITKFEKYMEVIIENKIENLVKKVQKQYSSDIFGFGQKIKKSNPKVWKKIYPKYNEIYPYINVKSNVDIQIKGTALFRKPIKIR